MIEDPDMPATAPHLLRVGELELTFLVDDSHGVDSIVMFEFTIPPHARVPAAHYHRDVDETVYGFEGTITSQIDGRTAEVRAGETLVIPRGTVHCWQNVHDTTARGLVTLTPGSITRRYFEEVAAELNVAGKPDLEAIKNIMLRYGLVPA
jgi:quercetin dioxygenase-like cupin family protein